MPFQPAPGIWQVEVRYTQDLQEVENILHFRRSGSATQAAADALAAVMMDWSIEMCLPLMSNGVQLREVYVRDLGSSVFFEGTATPETPQLGGRTSPAMPNNVTMAISFRTGFGGRSARGRNFVIGLTDNQVTNNSIVTSEGALWVQAYKDAVNYVGPLNLEWVVLSRINNKEPRENAVGFVILDVVLTNSIVDSQRRRLPGRGK